MVAEKRNVMRGLIASCVPLTARWMSSAHAVTTLRARAGGQSHCEISKLRGGLTYFSIRVNDQSD